MLTSVQYGLIMERGASFKPAARASLLQWADSGVLADRVYAELVSTLFTMTVPVAGLGVLYATLGALIYFEWQDRPTAALTLFAVLVTIARISLMRAYFRAGGDE